MAMARDHLRMGDGMSQRALVIAACCAGVALVIGYVDFVTGLYVSLTLMYLVPVVAASWFAGRSVGVFVAAVAGLSSLGSDALLLPTQNGPPMIWNALSRTVVLIIAAVAVDRIRRDRERLQLLDVQRGRALELLDRGLAVPARQLAELAAHWDGSADKLRAMLQPRAEEIAFMARDFSSMIRLHGGQLPLQLDRFDLIELVDEVRAEQKGERQITLTRPTSSLLVRADRARVRQCLVTLIGQGRKDDQVSLTLSRRGGDAELVIGSRSPIERDREAAIAARQDLDLSVELAQLLFKAQGGSLDLDRNPVTRALRVTARLPLA